MKADIGSRQDIEKMIARFYEKVKPDPVIGFIFTDVVHMDWEHHIPVIVDFWETILLDNPVYKKNAMEIHYLLNNKIMLQDIHFQTWLSLFCSTIDELFEGATAALAKKRAQSIASIMQIKIAAINKKKNVDE